MSYTVQFAQNEQTIRIRNTTNYIYYDIMMMNIIDQYKMVVKEIKTCICHTNH